MKVLMKIAAFAVAVAVVGYVSTALADVTTTTLDNGFTYITGGDDEPQPGVPDARYQMVLNKASAEGIPVVVVFVMKGCARCNRLETEFVKTTSEDVWNEWKKTLQKAETSCVDSYYPEWIRDGYPRYPDWIKSRGYLILVGMHGKGDGNKVQKLLQKGNLMPQVSVWWDKDGDGKSEIETKKVTWTGGDGNQHISRLMKKSDDLINKNGGYSPIPDYAGGTFDFEETETDRLETEDAAKPVAFTLTRGEKESEFASDVDIIAIGPDGETNSTQTVSWEAGDSNKVVSVDISSANFTKDGDQVTILLVDTNGVAQASNHVTYVEKENSFENPLWVTERSTTRSAPALDFGEWTMDLDGAKALAKSADGDAFVLAAAVGSLWCGDCANTEKNFTGLEDGDGNNLFQKWARENNVALVSIDVRRFDTNSVETTTGRSNATLLSRTPGSNGKSGRGYLTRKGVSDEDAAAMLERNRQLVSTTTAEGGFHRPEDANAYRTGVPYFVLLRKNETVASRFTIYATTSPKSPVVFEDVIKRFDEMLAIAGKGESEYADADEIENNYAATTPLEVEANGGKASAFLSCTDLRDAYKLANFGGNATLSLMVTGDTAQVELSLWKKNSDGTATMLDGAYRTGQLSEGVALEYTFAEAGDFYVQVAAKNRDPASAALDEEFSEGNKKANNFTAYTLTSEVAYYTPNGAKATAKAADGSTTVKMQLETGVLYRLVGLDGESAANAAALEPVEGADGFYRAKQSETVALDAAEDGGTVDYQKWEPGAVGFEPDAGTQTTEVTVSESTNLTVGVRRVIGVSGDVTVKIALNKEETDFYYDIFDEGVEDNKTLPRFKVDGELGFTEKEITWADGLPLEECVDSLLVQAADSEYGLISQYFGPGKVVFDFTIVAQTEAGEATNVVDNGKFTIKFTEDQKPEAGTVAILDAVNDAGEGWVKKQTIYAREDGSATLTLGRLESSQGPIYAELTPSVKGVVFGGD